MSSVAARNSHAQIGFGGLLALLILAYFWIGPQPFLDTAELDSSSSLVSQLSIALLTALAIFQGLRMQSPIGMGSHILVGLLLLWMLISALAAADSAVALRSSVIQALFIINAVLLPTLPRSEAEFARICRLAVLAALVLAYFGVMMLPHVSIHQASDPSEPMLAGLWRGHFVHKNAASSAMALAVFFGIYSYATGARLLGIAMVAASIYFLVHTGGKTSLLTMPAIILLAWLVERFSLLRLPLIVGGLIAFNVATLGAAISPAISDAIASLGVDATFTNRVDIWRIALRLASESPLTGEGLHTFWRSYAAVYGGGTIETWAYSAGTAHNGYLDVAMHLGLPGLLLIVLLFVLRPITQISQALASGNDTALTRLFLRIWLFGVFNACVESIFLARGSVLWFVFMVAVFGLQLQAKARLVPSSITPRSRGAVAHA